jgi:SPP1 family phage portal protein
MEINDKLILDCLSELRTNQSKYSVYKRYYEGKHDILTNYAMQSSRSNQKVVVNFVKRFIDERVSYVVTNPINYMSRSGDRAIEGVIGANIAINERLSNQNLLKQAQIYGKAYSLCFINSKGSFNTTTLTPLECYVLESDEIGEDSVLAIRLYKPKFGEDEFLDVYTDIEVIRYKLEDNDKSLIFINRKEHFMGQVPVVLCRANNEESSLIDDIKSLNDSFNNVLADLVNEVSDLRLAFLKVVNAELDEEEARKMKASGIIHINGDKANVDYLIKNINDTFVQNLLQELEEKMFKLVSTVDSNEKIQSNTSSLSIRARLFLLESVCGLIQSELEHTIRQKIQMFFNVYAIKSGVQYNSNDLILKFTPNLPSDIASLSDSVSKLKDLVSQRTLLSLLPFIEDPDREIELFKAEQDYIELGDLDGFRGEDV